MRFFIPSIRMLLFMTVLTGVVYPFLVTILSHALFEKQANGSLVRANEIIQGSKLVAQEFKSPQYFWPRPSIANYSPLPSSASNLSQTSADLKRIVDERANKLRENNPQAGEPPQDLLFASGSGLDPHISPAAARFQIARVAAARSMDKEEITKLVDRVTEDRQLGFLGEPRVNVFVLNLALDEAQGRSGNTQ